MKVQNDVNFLWIGRVEMLFEYLKNRRVLNILIWFVAAILLNGLGMYSTVYFDIGQNPFVSLKGATYYQDALLLPLFTFFTGLRHDYNLFIIFSLSIFLTIYWITQALLENKYCKLFAAYSLVFITIHPISMILLNGLGSSDGLTILFAIILTVINHPAPLIIFSGLGTLTHPLFGFIAISIIAIRGSSSDKNFSLIQFISILLGCFSGYLATYSFLSLNQIEMPFTRVSIMTSNGFWHWWQIHVQELPLSIFSLYLGIWFMIMACIAYGFRFSPKYYLTFISIQIFALIIAFFTWDLTRIFTILTFASTLHCLLYTLNIRNLYPDRTVDIHFVWHFLLPIMFWLPRYFAWSGGIVPAQVIPFWKMVIKII